MRSNQVLSRTVAAILAAAAVHSVPAASAGTVPPVVSAAHLQEVIVTATRRAENLQNVPIAIQALTARTLRHLNVHTLSGYLSYLPNVTTASMGPGQDMIFMRGLSTTNAGTQGEDSVGDFPNVGTYLDGQSLMLPARNLDVYAVDLQRIEVDEGPQGTLFGAGAEAGAIRYITNKPRLNTLSVDVNAGYGITAHGGPNSNVNAVFNLPLIRDRLAARLVFFTDDRGGYINNLPATFARGSTDLGIAAANGGVVPTNSVAINNYQIAARHINPLTYKGIRAEVLYKINDNWNVLLSQMFQNMDAQGVFYQMPYGTEGAKVNDATGVPVGSVPLPSLSVNLFNPSFDKDRFENTALTVHGEAGPLSLVYSGSYLDRNVDQVQDYTNYARGRYGYYYQCTGVSYSATAGNANATCYSPSAVWRESVRNTDLQQELRVSTPNSWRLRAIAGLFYQDLNIFDDTAWQYKSVPDCAPSGPTSNCFLPVQPWPNVPAVVPGVRNSSTAFFDDFKRVFIQKAAYISTSFDIIPHTLTITGGMRYFDMYSSEIGGDVGSFGCKQSTPTTYFGPCLGSNGTNFANQNHTLVETGHLGRASLSWHITPDVMMYYTYSQGFRPGGFNRGTSPELPDQNGVPQFFTPINYTSDILTNNELGWKATLFDGKMRINGALYQESWNHVQTEFFCPQCGFGNLTFFTNGPHYRLRGIEMQIAARPMAGLTVEGSFALNSGEQINSPALIDNNPASANYGKPITTRYVGGVAVPVRNPFGPRGGNLALSPPFKANLRVRYERPVGSYLAFVQAGFQHSAASISSTAYFSGFPLPSWTTYNASVGVSKDSWTVSLIGTNLTNVDKSLFTTDTQFTLTQTPMRPRVLELTFSYHFERHE